MKAGIYIRVSTQEQAQEGYSIEAQTERLTNYCKAKDWNIYYKYIDPGYSGSNINRPAVQKLISDVKNKKIDIVAVYKLDRLSRSQKDTLYLIEDIFLKNGVDFVSMNENFDTSSAFGRAMIGILSVFAQLEREQIKERTSMGRMERAKNGYWHGGGFDPVGYDYINGELVINEYEAVQVKEIFDLFIKGYTINQISLILFDKGYKTKYGNWKYPSTVNSCLNLPLYIGKISYGGNLYTGRHQPIIDLETWNKAQKIYKSQSLSFQIRGSQKTPYQATTLLSGLLFCGNCGARYYCKRNTSKNRDKIAPRGYYTCYSRGKTNKKMVIDPTCKNKTYFIDDLDKIVTDEIFNLHSDKNYFNEIVNKNKNNEPNKKEILIKRLDILDKELAKIMDLYQLGTIPIELISERAENISAERNSLQAEINSSSVPKEKMSKSEVINTAKIFVQVLEKGTLREKRVLIRSLIDKIVLKDNEVIIHWSFI